MSTRRLLQLFGPYIVGETYIGVSLTVYGMRGLCCSLYF